MKMQETSTLMAKKGLNLRESPQLLDINYALEIKNYIITSEGTLEKRGGEEELFAISSTEPGRMLEKYTDDLYMYAYGDSVSVYSKSADASTVIKTYSSTSTVYSGQRYGNYFFVTNGKDKLVRISRTLAYDDVTKAFTLDEIVTGGTSGAKGVVLENNIDYTPAFLTGGSSATSVVATWTAVTDGEFAITIDGTAYDITEIDFSSGITTMDDVAAKIQEAIRLETEGSETCVWSTDHFVITSGSALSNSAITVTSAVSGGTGTDISGVAATPFLDAESGQGTVTNAVKLTTGTLTLGEVEGVFQDDEALTDPKGGSATVNGTISWAADDVMAAPIGQVLRVIANRLFIGNLISDQSAVVYSAADDGSNPPFTNWTVGTLATDPGKLYYRSAGAVRAIESLGTHVVVFSENGKWGFRIITIDSAGTLSKVDDTSIQRIDTGGSRGALGIPQGLFYINEGGLWQLLAVGSDDLPTSTQEQLTSVLLGTKYFEDIDLTNADIVYSQKFNSLFITVADDSTKNNKVIVYNLDYQAFSEFSGWNINGFLNDNDTIYGISANSPTVYELFKGDDDDGNDIETSYRQEISVGGLNRRKQLNGVYTHGYLSPSTSINVKFDIYDREGKLVTDKIAYTWTAAGAAGALDGYGTAEWGSSPWGGDSETAGLVESFSGGSARIKNFQRIRLHLTEQSKTNHQITYFTLLTKEKKQIRRRNLTQLT